MKQSNFSLETYVGYFLILFSVISYVYLVVNYSFNMPVNDDYNLVLGPLEGYSQTDSLIKKAEYLVVQHNVHVILVFRLMFLLQYEFFGSINFLLPIYVGNLLWLAIIGIIYKNLRVQSIFHLGIICVLVLTWQYYISSVWGTLMFYTLFFAACSFVLISKESLISLIGSIFFAFLAMFNTGNGFIVLLLLVVYFVLLNQYSKRFWATLISAVLLIGLYFIVFFKFPESNEGFESTFLPLRIIQYASIFLTSNLWAGLHDPSVFYYKLSILGWLFYFYSIYHIIKNKYYKSNPSIVLLALFIVGSALTTAYGRADFGIFQAGSIRYRLYPSLFSALIFIMYFDSTYSSSKGRDVIKWIVSVFAIIILIVSIQWFYPHVQHYEKLVKSGAFLYDNNITKNELPIDYGNAIPIGMLDKSVESGMFSVPKYSITDVDVWRENATDIVLKSEINLDVSSIIRNFSITDKYAYLSIKKNNDFNYISYLALSSDSDTLYFALSPQNIKHQYKNPDCQGVLLNIEKYKEDYSDVFLIENHQNGSRKLYLGRI